MKYPLNTNRLFFLPFLTLISLLFGCGGGGSNATQHQPEKTRSPYTSEIPHEKCSVVVTGESEGVSYKLLSESDYKGDIKFNCSYDDKQPTSQQYFLINGVPSLNIVQLRRNTKITSNCTLNNTSFTDTVTVDFNYQTGLVTSNVKSTENGVSSCKSRFKTPLATTLSDHKSIMALLDQWGIDVSEANKAKTGLIKTDCPQTVHNNTGSDAPVCKTIINNKYTFTDDTGKNHTLEKKVSF